MLLKRIELITGPLAFLAWIVLIAVAAQSLPPIALAWRWPIAGGAIVVLLTHAVLCLWNDYHASRPETGGDDES